MMDHLSKVVHFTALHKLPSAKETARVIIDHVFRIHGFPEDVVSDRGPQFISHFWKEFCQKIGASVSLSLGFNLQTIGQSERVNQDLSRIFQCLASHNPTTWSQQLTWAEYAHNSLPVSSTGLFPFMCCLGCQPLLFSSHSPEAAIPSVQAFIQRCRCTSRRVREALIRSRGCTKIIADRYQRMACGVCFWATGFAFHQEPATLRPGS